MKKFLLLLTGGVLCSAFAFAQSTISTDKQTYALGEKITVSWTGAASTGDWIAIYTSGEVPGQGGSLSKDWAYTNGTISVPGTVTADGSLEFPLNWTSQHNGYDISQRPNYYFVDLLYGNYVSRTGSPAYFYVNGMILDKKVYNVGETVKVTVANSEATTGSQDWICIYQPGKTAPGSGNSAQYEYLKAKAETVELNKEGNGNWGMDGDDPLPAGVYYVCYLYGKTNPAGDGGWYSMNVNPGFGKKYFVVGTPVTLTSDKAEYEEGENVEISFAGAPEWDEENVLRVYDAAGVEFAAYSLDLAAVRGTVDVTGLPAGAYTAKVVTLDGTEKAISETLAFSVNKTVNLTLGYATFSASTPYTIDGTAVKAYKAVSKTGNYVKMEEMADIPANTGVVLYGEGQTSVTLKMAASATADVSDNLLKPNVAASTLPATEGGNTNYILVKEGEKIVFAPTSGSGTLKAHRAYLQLPTDGTAKYFISFGDETGIDDDLTVKSETAAPVYNLQGQRVAAPTKGVFIQNGKKVVMK